LRHAESCGVAVFEQVKATSIQFEANDPTLRPIAACYENKSTSSVSTSGKITFDYLVDASGRMGIMSQKYQAPIEKTPFGSKRYRVGPFNRMKLL